MSEYFHKNCYTSRSSGYKYRTLGSNTGDKKRRDVQEDNVFDKKFKELKKTIYSKIEKEVRYSTSYCLSNKDANSSRLYRLAPCRASPADVAFLEPIVIWGAFYMLIRKSQPI